MQEGDDLMANLLYESKSFLYEEFRLNKEVNW